MRWLLALLANLVLWAAPSAACSVKDGYRVPTNFELVLKADVIVLARVGSVPASMEAAGSGNSTQLISLKPLQFLKGSAAQSELRLMGWRPPKNWEGVPTATTLWQSHFSAGLGACIRQFYEPGDLVVAIFERDPKAKQIIGQELIQVFDPWARVVETVDGPDDIWVHSVERYVALQAGDPATMKQRIESEIQQLRSADTPEAQAIAADLDYHLRRDKRVGTWGSFSMPTFTAAAVAGQQGAQLYCFAGTPPGVMLAGNQSPAGPLVVVDGVNHATMAAAPTPVEQVLLKGPVGGLAGQPDKAQPISIYRLSNPATLAALKSAVKNVAIEVAGKQVIGGPPLDALVRWASQCDKLQKLPAPTEEELRPPSL